MKTNKRNFFLLNKEKKKSRKVMVLIILIWCLHYLFSQNFSTPIVKIIRHSNYVAWVIGVLKEATTRQAGVQLKSDKVGCDGIKGLSSDSGECWRTHTVVVSPTCDGFLIHLGPIHSPQIRLFRLSQLEGHSLSSPTPFLSLQSLIYYPGLLLLLVKS